MKSKGFTLIELLVVVAIIGILATVVLASLGAAREKARDAKQVSEIKQIQNALELYYLDNGKYPGHGASPNGISTYLSNTSTDLRNFENNLSPYIDLDLTDDIWGPWLATGDYQFRYTSPVVSNHQTYALFAFNSDAEGLTFGDLPDYCNSKYTGGNAGWWHAGTSLCVGGN